MILGDDELEKHGLPSWQLNPQGPKGCRRLRAKTFQRRAYNFRWNERISLFLSPVTH
jgi:hypothetical protein